MKEMSNIMTGPWRRAKDDSYLSETVGGREDSLKTCMLRRGHFGCSCMAQCDEVTLRFIKKHSALLDLFSWSSLFNKIIKSDCY